MPEKSKDKCQARTKSGNRCKRSASTGSVFCGQHTELINNSLWSHPGGKIEYVPDPPDILTNKGTGFWMQYCRLLLEHDMLWGVYLGDLSELCWRIDFRDELEKDIEDKGLFNTHAGGIQLIGFDKILDRNDKRITDLKKQFGFTLDTASKLSPGRTKKSESDKEKKGNVTQMKSVKNF